MFLSHWLHRIILWMILNCKLCIFVSLQHLKSCSKIISQIFWLTLLNSEYIPYHSLSISYYTYPSQMDFLFQTVYIYICYSCYMDNKYATLTFANWFFASQLHIFSQLAGSTHWSLLIHMRGGSYLLNVQPYKPVNTLKSLCQVTECLISQPRMVSRTIHIMAFDSNHSGQSRATTWNLREAILCQAAKSNISNLTYLLNIDISLNF